MVGKLDQIERNYLFEDFLLFEFGFQFSFATAQIDERPGDPKLLILELRFVLEEKSLDNNYGFEFPLLNLLREPFVVLV